MVHKTKKQRQIVCIVGLGYVGLPLAEAFSKYFRVIGFDVDEKKVSQLQNKYQSMEVTSNPAKIKHADYIIIAVPTPVIKSKQPDLSFVISAENPSF